jgi:nicotinate-nucleotide pyrophosphorylase (carboxylating)
MNKLNLGEHTPIYFNFVPMIDSIIQFALTEDIGEGDHTSLSCVPEGAIGKAKLIIKDTGVLAGVELAQRIFNHYDPSLQMTTHIMDGTSVKPGDIAFEVTGKSRSILATERLVLNFMQRMSGIATETRSIVNLIEGTSAQLLDTRKTTPGIRAMEKWAVTIGGGVNHRFGLYELDEVLAVGQVDRIMLDNFTPEEIKRVLSKIPSNYETEASGGITKENIRGYAETGVNFISSGALTHSVKSLDMSLKAEFNN